MSKSTPLISIIVPIYNTADYLPTCLDSILAQTYQNIEIVLINDGSTDNSTKIAQDYIKKDPRIKLFNQKNQGLSAARNTGIQKSTGEYLTFVDSDDAIEPTMLKSMLTALKTSKATIAVCSFKEIYPNGKIVHFNHQHYPTTTYNTEEALSAMLEERGFMVSVTMKLFPHDYFKTVKFPVGKLHEDLGTTYKLIMQASKIVFLPDEFYLYYHHGTSITTQKFDNRKLDIIALTDEMCDDIDKAYPSLINITNKRRIRARFSILRQIPHSHPQLTTITNYLKSHKSYITSNPTATKSDKLALKLALTSPRLFQLAYKLFKS